MIIYKKYFFLRSSSQNKMMLASRARWTFIFKDGADAVRRKSTNSEEGRGVLEICKHLRSHHWCTVSRQAIHWFLRHGSLVRRRKLVTSSARKILAIHRRFIKMWLTQNNELTACDSQRKLKDLFRLSVSLSCVRKVRRELGWSSNTGKYSQQISHKKKNVKKNNNKKLYKIHLIKSKHIM